MTDPHNLRRFLDAQQSTYADALSEIQKGRKRSHWMLFIFPQIQGLGFSEMSRHYGIKDAHEAQAYLQHPVLGERLITICNALLASNESSPSKIFGSPDDLKLKSCMTLFASVPETNDVFAQVLDKFFKGRKDETTLKMLKRS